MQNDKKSFHQIDKYIRSKDEFLHFLQSYGIEANYQLGQNFLYNEEFIAQVLNRVYPEATLDTVLEIGPGPGSLSRVLCQSAKRVEAIEIDRSFEKILADLEKSSSNFTVHFGDALTLNFQEILGTSKENIHIIANLPYYITSDLILKSIEELAHAKSMFFLVQKDVYPRLKGSKGDGKSKSKNQGYLNKCIEAYGSIRLVQNVSKDRFYPAPRVDSAFVLLEERQDSPEKLFMQENAKLVIQIIQTAFSARRKTMINCFKSVGKEKAVSLWLENNGKAENTRAEALHADDFLRLSAFLHDIEIDF